MQNKIIICGLVSLTLIVFLAGGCGKSDSGHQGHSGGVEKKTAKYHCPMHPTYVSDKPGDCPICGMALVPIPAEKDKNAPADKEAGIARTPGRITIRLPADKQQLIGLRLSPVETRDLALKVRTTAVIEHDETRYARIAPRFGGWARELKVNFTGQTIEKGQPLLTVYSPELLTAENEYLLTLERFERVKKNPADPQYEAGRQLMESARRRLLLWEIGEQEISELEKSHKPKDEILLRAPVSGHVVTKNAVEGKAFMPGETLYEIADLAHLWLRAYVFEFELPLVKVGQKARIILPYLGNKTYESTITFIYPHIEQQTRRAEMRLEVENTGLELRPGMWADVEMDASFGKVLTVPASAVIDTGERYLAFVQTEDEHLEPRELKIGAKTDDYYQVLEGVKEGDKVVTRALFLVDSESQLKAAFLSMGAAGEHKH